MLSSLLPLLLVVLYFPKSSTPARINTGLSLLTLAGMCGVANALVQGGVIGFVGELPERYMQTMVAGTVASGVLVSPMRVITKAIYPQDTHGLRQSAILYFIVGIVLMVICIVCYNAVDWLSVVIYYKNIKRRAQKAEEGGEMTGSTWRSTLWSFVGRVTSVLMILTPKAVPIHHSETVGIVIVLFLVIGLVIGSFVAWFWVI